MLWTDYFKIRDTITLIENSIRNLDELQRGRKDTMAEIACIEGSLEVLKEMRKEFIDALLDIQIHRAIESAEKALLKSYSSKL
jgi:hypothetical protein